MPGKDPRPALTTLLLVLVTACSAPAAAPGPPVPTTGVRTGLTDVENGLLADAERRLITTCMKEKGFAYTVDVLPEDRDRAPDRPFGLDDVAWARHHGYGLDTDGPRDDGRTAVRVSTQERYLASLTPERRRAFDRALDGKDRAAITVEVPGRGQVFTSADGCQADARRRLYGDLRAWTEAKAIVVNLGYLTWDQVVSAPEYTTALESWRTCMAGKGFAYADSSEAIGDVAARGRAGSAGTARERERRTAVADAECNRDAGLARTGTRLQRERIRAAARTRFARQARHFTDAVTGALAEARALTRHR
ncbi:hypothetical protein [Streptomyces sp. cmx-4-7]|uniref:hypothetical protein n=1 Tax=Streptomyces sp. cmx-4-7 TaxID=2790939 RepID=UPI00397F4BFC